MTDCHGAQSSSSARSTPYVRAELELELELCAPFPELDHDLLMDQPAEIWKEIVTFWEEHR